MRLLALLLCLCLAPLFAEEVIAREGKGRLIRRPDGQRVLYLSGTPYEMGVQHGRLLREEVRRNAARLNEGPGEFGQSMEFRLYKLGRPLMHARLRPHVPARFVEEMRGVAEGAGVSYAEVEALNLFPSAFHCSGMAFHGPATHDGSLYQVRILDYFTKLGLQDTAIVVMQSPAGRHAFLNVGFAGFVGSVTGMNARQISIGEMGGRGLFYWNGMPMALLVRDALERAGTLAEACAVFRDNRRECEYYYVIGDGKIPDSRGVWATPDRIEFFEPGKPFGFCEYDRPGRGAEGDKVLLRDLEIDRGPYHLRMRSGHGKTEVAVALPPPGVIAMSGFDRYCHFMRKLEGEYGKLDAPTLQSMIVRPVSMSSNLHNAIFHPASLRVWVAVAAIDGSPSCDQSYYEYQLKPEPESAPPPAAR